MKFKHSQSGQFGIMVIIIALVALTATLSVSVQVSREMQKSISESEGLQKLNDSESLMEDLLNTPDLDDLVGDDDLSDGKKVEKLENPEIRFKEGESIDAIIDNNNCNRLEIYWNDHGQNNKLIVTFYREIADKIIANQFPLSSNSNNHFITASSLPLNANQTRNYQSYYQFNEPLNNTKLIKIQLLNGESYIKLQGNCSDSFAYILKTTNVDIARESRQTNLLVTDRVLPAQFQYTLFTPDFTRKDTINIPTFSPIVPPTNTPAPFPTFGPIPPTNTPAPFPTFGPFPTPTPLPTFAPLPTPNPTFILKPSTIKPIQPLPAPNPIGID